MEIDFSISYTALGSTSLLNFGNFVDNRIDLFRKTL
jgi:hypothetical protein